MTARPLNRVAIHHRPPSNVLLFEFEKFRKHSSQIVFVTVVSAIKYRSYLVYFRQLVIIFLPCTDPPRRRTRPPTARSRRHLNYIILLSCLFLKWFVTRHHPFRPRLNLFESSSECEWVPVFDGGFRFPELCIIANPITDFCFPSRSKRLLNYRYLFLLNKIEYEIIN